MQAVKTWVDKAEDQFRRGRYAEVVISANKAITIDPENSHAWLYLAFSYEELDEFENALEAYETVTKLEPDLSQVWVSYGNVIKLLRRNSRFLDSRYPSAESAYEKAIELDSENIEALTALSEIYRGTKDPDRVDRKIFVFGQLYNTQGWLSPRDLNELGLSHYNRGTVFEAIKYWADNAYHNDHAISLYNLGLAYSHTSVMQDIDALDAWRLASLRHPKYSKSYEQINYILPQLQEHEKRITTNSKTLLKENQWYQHYINPFELLDFQENIDDPASIDIKKIQRYKKALLREIELEGGVFSTVNGLKIDRSQAISVCDELYDEQKLAYHLHVFNNKSLLGFLARGEHQHFLVDLNIFALLETLSYLNEPTNGFKKWLSEPFKKQYQLIVTKCIEVEDIALLRFLVSGRRWIIEPYADDLFTSIGRKLDSKLVVLEEIERKLQSFKPSPTQVNQVITENRIAEILNLFPSHLRGQQEKAVGIVRNIAIESYNHYQDTSLTKKLLEITNRFSFKTKRIEELLRKDIETIDGFIEQEHEHDAIHMVDDEACGITADTVWKGHHSMSVSSIVSLRWGAIVGNYGNDYLFSFKANNGAELTIQWRTAGSQDKHQEINQSFTTATLHYILGSVLEKMVSKLKAGGTVLIGGCSVTASGISFDTKWLLFTQTHHIPWEHVTFDISNGVKTVIDIREPKKRIDLPLRDTGNAVILQFLQQEVMS